jgi:hypothetical protein
MRIARVGGHGMMVELAPLPRPSKAAAAPVPESET